MPPKEREDGTKSWPYVAYTDRYHAARAALNALVDQDGTHDYIDWQQNFAGKLDDPATISGMDARNLAYQVTRFNRGERFSDGFGLRFTEDGALLAALERALALATDPAT